MDSSRLRSSEGINFEYITNLEQVEEPTVRHRDVLPIDSHKEEIQQAIRNNSMLVLMSPTGSGKTTRVPAFAQEMGEFDQIICTQPRRVATYTLAERIAFEAKNSDRNYTVGYFTGDESSEGSQRDYDVALATDGKVALQILNGSKNFDKSKKRLLIIDEVHEWNVHIEVLIALAAEMTDPSSSNYDPNLKVVIMSATMDAQRILEHFKHAKPPLRIR
jgi:HrpA-like RNA helicase